MLCEMIENVNLKFLIVKTKIVLSLNCCRTNLCYFVCFKFLSLIYRSVWADKPQMRILGLIQVFRISQCRHYQNFQFRKLQTGINRYSFTDLIVLYLHMSEFLHFWARYFPKFDNSILLPVSALQFSLQVKCNCNTSIVYSVHKKIMGEPGVYLSSNSC